ncbi:sigma 54-interacting transcriptional regulator [Desulfobacterales bacterium HSG17]|nr:sigma 54-interacting transcriptional regulator [Desulfobacterales bacterium HSG17]
MKNRLINNLELSQVDFLSILSEFDDGIIIADKSGIIVFYNKQQAKMDRLDPEKVIARKVTDVYNLDEDTSKIMQCLKSREPIIGHLFFYRTTQGRLVNTIHSVFPLFKAEKLIGAICVVKDYNILDKTIASSSTLMNHDKPDLGNGTRFTFADMVSANSKFLNCIKTARLAASSPSPVMLFGETGTGKEIFAQSIHNYSSRKQRRFMAINCAAIPENLLEGILFGTAKGAFTSALDKPGLFEQANGGTLFLDEIDSMPINLQSKLLRVLQEKRVRRVGSLDEIRINIKIISTINREPRQAIADNILRIDLFYRIGVVFIHIPPLFERPDDIEVLTSHFIKKLNFILEKKVEDISEDVKKLFMDYHWPGNVRELEHIIEGAMNMIGDEKIIHNNHLPSYFSNITDIQEKQNLKPEKIPDIITPDNITPDNNTPDNITPDNNTPGIIPKDIPIKDSPAEKKPDFTLISRTEEMAEHEKIIIADMLKEYRGNVSRSAQKLGISRQLLHYKMKKYGLNRKDYL